MLVEILLSNVFSMRIVGTKTHGDLAEIAFAEFVNQYVHGYSSTHVGKDRFRSKLSEEDVIVKNDATGDTFSLSLKAYGEGPLQLFTDKSFRMFPRLESEDTSSINDKDKINAIFQDSAFDAVKSVNVLSLIYREDLQSCSIITFDYQCAIEETAVIQKLSKGKGRIHPVYRFLNRHGKYIFEVRYGNARANALQRGLWTHTVWAKEYFSSITGGWIDYSENREIVDLLSCALVASPESQRSAMQILRSDINARKEEILS